MEYHRRRIKTNSRPSCCCFNDNDESIYRLLNGSKLKLRKAAYTESLSQFTSLLKWFELGFFPQTVTYLFFLTFRLFHHSLRFNGWCWASASGHWCPHIMYMEDDEDYNVHMCVRSQGIGYNVLTSLMDKQQELSAVSDWSPPAKTGWSQQQKDMVLNSRISPLKEFKNTILSVLV